MTYLRRASGLWCPDYHLRFPPERGFAQPNYSILPGHFPAGAVARAAGVVAPLEFVQTTSERRTGTGKTFTWNSVSIGAAPTGNDRRYVVAVFGTNAAANNVILDGATIGGAAATEVALAENTGSGSCNVGMWFLEVPTGATTDIVFSLNSSGNDGAGGNLFALSFYSGSGGASLRQAHSDAPNNNPSVTYDATAGDLVVGGTQYRNGRISSYDTLVIDEEEAGISSDYGTIGHAEIASSVTGETESPNASNSGNEECLVLGVFKPD